MSVTPEKDPNYIYAHPYATLIADEYRMRGGYCIVRPGGTDDHLMLLTRAVCHNNEHSQQKQTRFRMTPFAKYWTLCVEWRHEKHVAESNERIHRHKTQGVCPRRKKPRSAKPNGASSFAAIATLRYTFSTSLRRRSLSRSSSS